MKKTLTSLALAGLVAGGLFGSAAFAGHSSEENYSPCRPTDADETRLGYEDTEDRDDIRHELPTIYAKGDPEAASGYIGMCGGGAPADNPSPVRYIEAGGSPEDGPYLAGDSGEEIEGEPLALDSREL